MQMVRACQSYSLAISLGKCCPDHIAVAGSRSKVRPKSTSQTMNATRTSSPTCLPGNSGTMCVMENTPSVAELVNIMSTSRSSAVLLLTAPRESTELHLHRLFFERAEHHQHQLFCLLPKLQTHLAPCAAMLFARCRKGRKSSQHQLFCSLPSALLFFADCCKWTEHHQHQLRKRTKHDQNQLFRSRFKSANEPINITAWCALEPSSVISISNFPIHPASAVLPLTRATTARSIVSMSCSAPCPCHKRTEHYQHQLFCSMPMPQNHRASSASAFLVLNARSIISSLPKQQLYRAPPAS